MAHDYDLRNTSILSQSYMKGVERLTGNGNTYEEEFKLTEEIFESRKKTWSWLFDKFSEISDDVELKLQTLRPESESSSSHGSELRIPVRKSAAQLQYWIDTGNPPCKVTEVAVSDSDETLSISESEPTDFEEDKSSLCTSMIVNKKLTNSEGNIINTGSSASSVDTTVYILENTNSGVKNDRDYRGFNIMGNLDNNIVRRSIRTATSKALLSRSLDVRKNVEKKFHRSIRRATSKASLSSSLDVQKNVEKKVRRSIRRATSKASLSRSLDIPKNVENKVRKLIRRATSKASVSRSLDAQKNVENKVRRSTRRTRSKTSLSRSMDIQGNVENEIVHGSPKTATPKALLNRSLDIQGNIEGKIVDRLINAATPKVLLSRSMESFKNAKVYDKISGISPQSMSAGVEGEIISRSRNADTVDIGSDNDISHQIDKGLKKGTKIDKIKDSEATFESKESGIGSSAVESTGKGDTNESKRSSNCSDKIFPVQNQSLSNRRRKLYTKDDSFFDLISPIVKTVQRMKAARKSFHPALDSPSVSSKKKTTSKSRLLTSRGRKSVNCSIRKRNKNRSIISKSKVRPNSCISQADESRVSDSVKTNISPMAEVPNHPLTVGADSTEKNKEVASLVEETLPTAAAAMSENKSSSSLSSNDVSQIINEEMNRISGTPVASGRKKNEPDHSPVARPLRSEKRDHENDQGSIFQPSAGSSSESKESRLRNMMLVKKNLCETDLRSSMDTDSPSVSDSCNTVTKDDEDSMSTASTILLPHSKRRTRSLKSLKNELIEQLKSSSEFIPKVILHDFLKLKNCCGELEKENNENWLQKENEGKNLKTDEIGVEKENVENYLANRNERENLKADDNRDQKENNKNLLRKRNDNDNSKTDKIGVEEKVNSDEKRSKNIKSKKKMDDKVPQRKRLRLEREAASSKSCPKILFTSNVASATVDSDSSEEKTTHLGTEKANDDCNEVTTTVSKYSLGIKPKAESRSKENPRITFTNTNHNRWESLFILTSSDEEDLIKKLNNTSKSKSFGNKSNRNKAEVEPSTSVVVGSTSIDDSVESKFTKTIQDSYKIVYSSTEEEEKIPVKSRPSKIVTKKYSKRNKRENSMELTIRSREDECGYRSESPQIENEKSEKQSPGVNSRRSERKKGKQSSETGRKDHIVSQSSKVNRETRKKLRDENVSSSSDKPDTVISSKRRKDVDRVSEQKITEKENEPNRISENWTMPVDRDQETRGDTSRRIKSEIFRKMACAADFTDSEEELEVDRLTKRKDKSKSSSNTEEKDDEMMSDATEPRIAPSSALILASNDESLDNDDVMTLFSSNYAGDNFRDKNKDKDDKSSVVGSKKDPDHPNQRGTKFKKGPSSSSRKKTSKNRRCTNSTIVFRTKEYWELDSDNS